MNLKNSGISEILNFHPYICLQGLIDISKEMTKLGGKKDKLSAQLEKIQTDMAKSDYSTKVPEEIQKQNTDKVSDYTSYSSALFKKWTLNLGLILLSNKSRPQIHLLYRIYRLD